ncbi:MAG: Rrf2 family transcriptional regulator [Candidatus Marinimicrobia bacterium]|nr:Rrf2 family transcriptional regulator [Candidatus Neomarinimicrobiota bacterium]MCH7763120.1 Rrf2 family transcriptional regulator [Candidatus Neomarinimicrobiota bacterium]
MGISKASDYAILIMAYFSSQPEGTIRSKSGIAKDLSLPGEYLSKILQKLTKSGMIISIKGVKGGYRLKEFPCQLTFLDVIESIDGKINIVECLSEDFKGCRRQNICMSLIKKMSLVNAGITNVLRNTTFTDISVPVLQ